jgi:ribosomal protein L11 methyltransferase
MIALRITLPAAREEDAVTLLWEMGTAGVEVQPAQDGTLALLSYFAVAQAECAALVTRLSGELTDARIEITDVPDVDWVARFRDGFRPFSVGNFHIVPAWEQGARLSDRVLRIDPGRAFGTGTHESTRLCLRLLERLASERALGRVLDVGAGTGILALAAVRLGAGFVVASDFDADALLSCRRHADLNDVHLRLLRADGGRAIRPGRFDVLVANLMAPLLIERAKELAAVFTGSAILAGLLVEEVEDVRSAFSACDPDPGVERLGEWAALCLTKRVA